MFFRLPQQSKITGIRAKEAFIGEIGFIQCYIKNVTVM